MLKGVGKYLKLNKGGGRIYIPSKIVYDSQFPLKNTSKVEIKIKEDKIIIIKK